MKLFASPQTPGFIFVSKLLPAFVGILCAVSVLSGCSPSSDTDAAPPAQEVGVIELQPHTIPMIIRLSGRTTASTVAEIRPQVAGIIQQKSFTEGMQVQAGDQLYQIDPKPYQAALASAQATLNKAQAAVPSAQALVERYEKLLSVRGVSQQEMDEARASLQAAKADVAAAQAALQSAQINLDYTQVTTPIDGIVATSTVTQGALVTADQGTALTTVRQTDPMYVDLTDSSSNVLRLRQLVQQGRVTLSARPHPAHLSLGDNLPYPLAGEVSALDLTISETTDSFSVRATFPNPEHQLLPGLFVSAEIDLGQEQNVFLIPQRALNRNAKGQASALFVGAGNKAETRLLDTAHSYRDKQGVYWVVYSGINAGDRLIVDGAQKVRNGQAVKPVAITLNADGVAVDKASVEKNTGDKTTDDKAAVDKTTASGSKQAAE